MKKGIVIALAILMIFVLVGCGEKDFSTNENDSIDQQLIGTSWYQSQTTETDIGEGVLSGGEWGLYVENITLSIITTVTYEFNDSSFTCTTKIVQKKSGWTNENEYIEREVSTETESVNGTWHFENDRLYLIADNATTGVSYSVFIIDDELILENEYAGTFIRLKKK